MVTPVAAHMDEGRRRAASVPEPHWVAVPSVWSGAVMVPARPPALVYLDLNHWINLAKVVAGKVAPAGYTDLLPAVRRANVDRRATLVLSSSLVQEIWNIADPRQRMDLVGVIEDLTDFHILASPVDLMRVELLASVAELVGDAPPDVGTFPLVGTSLLHAFGMKGGLKIVDGEGRDRTLETLKGGDELRVRWPEIEREAERRLLAGPQDDELANLRAHGYRPEISRKQIVDNAMIEQDFADRLLTDRWRRGRIRDVLAAREVSLELIDLLMEELARRGITLGDVAGDLPRARALALSMPTSCVRVELKTQHHRNSSKKWTINDLNDIDALAVAIPYCDIVFTDAAVRNAARAAKLDERFGTDIPRRPADLINLLEALPDPVVAE